MKRKKVLGVLLSLLLVSIGADATERKDDILNAIRDGADYAVRVLLDEEGKSRCDYNMIEGKWYLYEPAWHTGQVIFGLVEAYRVTGDEKYLNEAKRAGDWWTSLQITDHPKLNGMLRALHGDYIGDYIVFATISDGASGLFQLQRESNVDTYAKVATEAGEWMLNNMWVPEHGVFYDVVDVHTGEVYKERSPFWSDIEDQTLYHVARPNSEGSLFKYMYEFTGDERYKDVFIAQCESLVDKQGPEGLWMDFMPNNKESGSFHPRFNIWYAESLLDGYDLTGDERYLMAAVNTARAYARAQIADGTIFYQNFLDGRRNRDSVCGSAVSFAGILWLRLLQYGVGDEFAGNLENSVTWVLHNRFSIDHPDPNLAGAFLETRTRRREGKVWMTMRDIATSFGLRFLTEYYRYRYGDS
jgi:rhamnogalacturonyl hydrolase YesR